VKTDERTRNEVPPCPDCCLECVRRDCGERGRHHLRCDLSFDPTVTGGGPGVGTVTGTVSIDTATNTVTAVDLTESTNDGLNAIGGAFGSPTYSTFTFNQVGTFTTYFFGQPQINPFDTVTLSGNDISLFFQSNQAIFDAQPVGPSLTIMFPYTSGGAVQPGTFASITSENRYLYGTVDPAVSAVPEPATWAMLIVGFCGVGFLAYRRGGAPSAVAA